MKAGHFRSRSPDHFVLGKKISLSVMLLHAETDVFIAVILASATSASETRSVHHHIPADLYSRILYVPHGESSHRVTTQVFRNLRAAAGPYQEPIEIAATA